MPKLVVHGAGLKCSEGATPGKLAGTIEIADPGSAVDVD